MANGIIMQKKPIPLQYFHKLLPFKFTKRNFEQKGHK